MNELTWMNWNKRTETNELKWMKCRPHLQKVVRTCQFYDFYVKSSSGYSESRAHFADLIFNKCKKSIFLYDIYVKWKSRHSHVHILSTTFRIEPRNRGNRDPPAATTDSHFTWKNTWFCARESFSREFMRSRSLTLLNYLMMMRLTWWCGWHDGTTASYENRSSFGSFLTRLLWLWYIIYS